VRKCSYCAFLSGSADEEAREHYVSVLTDEIALAAGAAQNTVLETIYFGGGTPTVLTDDQLERIMNAVRGNFTIADDTEITLEANPGTLTDSAGGNRFKTLRSIGFSRLSMGVQSMNDERLAFLGRIHSSEDVRRDVRLAREAGFDNINLDLIFSVPGETGDDALSDAEAIAALEPEHISCYSLQLEEGTRLYLMADEGLITEVPDEEDRDTYHRICSFLKDAGYEHYEISNFARRLPGASPDDFSPFRSRHNSGYWDMSDYIGTGLGSSGFEGSVRYRNVSSPEEYTRLIAREALPREDEHLNSEFDNVSEAVFTGLRRSEGISYAEAVRFIDGAERTGGRTAQEIFWQYFPGARDEAESFAASGHFIIDEEGLRLTEKGIDISNRIMALFV